MLPTSMHQTFKSDGHSALQGRNSCHVVAHTSSLSQLSVRFFLKICTVISIMTILVSQRPERIEFDDNSRNIAWFSEEQDRPIWKDDNPKRFLAIHIGPSKTGTTAIQKNSLFYQLGSDGVSYVGRFRKHPGTEYHSFRNCMMKTHMQQSNYSGYSIVSNGDECWKKFMASYEYNGTLPSILDSEEAHSSTKRKKESINNPGPFWLTKTYFESKGHDVILVATYRRYYEWLSSALLQQCHTHIFAPRVRATALWLHQGGVECIKTWYKAYSFVKNVKVFGTYVYSNIEAIVPEMREIGFNVKVMNYHDPMYSSAIVQNLYCNVLKEYTPRTCQESMQKLVPQVQKIENKGSNLHYYDAIVLEAAKRGLINTTKITRRDARNSLVHHHTQVLGKDYTDLPILCPPQKFLDDLLKKSLKFERVMSNELYSTDSVDASIEANHVEAFKNFTGERLGYCFPDVTRLFENVHSYSQLLEESLVKTWGKPQRLPT
jgi:hypothetical protein